MDITQWVKVDTPRLAQVFMRARIESFPVIMAGCPLYQHFRRPTAIHDRTFIFDLTMRLLRN
jgi:hypothetical protein